MKPQRKSPYNCIPVVSINVLLITQMAGSVRNDIMLSLTKLQNCTLHCVVFFSLDKLKFRVPTTSYLSYRWL